MKRTKTLAAAIITAAAVSMVPMTAMAFFTPVKTQAKTEDAFTFVSGLTEIRMGAEAQNVLAALGQTTKAVFETDSCAYQGKDRVYTYKDFEVSTFPKDGKECISALVVTGADVKTPEGISIGSKAADVVKTYGANDGKFGIYRYDKGNSELTFYTKADGSVEEIEYIYKQ